ncbi:50S ribosomal protein L13 [Candidatus Woesearchaeota archaeon]|nr:50S ribosomal protein L13 [Candidatus Woesearchaeota archaeon]
MIINAEDAIVGRMATVVAKKALAGEEINIVNCEKAIITGNKRRTIEKYKQRLERGQVGKGYYVFRKPEMIVKKIIRGMLPYKQEKGLKAFKRIKCYKGVPEEFKEGKMEKVKNADMSRLNNYSFLTVEKLCKELGVE